jgi:tRNA pseudouridine38-40 synthase
MLCGYEDFKTFEKKGGDNATSLCQVFEAHWDILEENRWCFIIRSNRFLRNMVRRITGALLMVGTGKLSLEDLGEVMNNKSDLEVTFAPPAHGLFLWAVTYPKEIWIDQ